MLKRNTALVSETIEEFLARGGKVNKLTPNYSAKRIMDKLKRAQARFTKNKQPKEAEKIQPMIDKYKRALSRK